MRKHCVKNAESVLEAGFTEGGFVRAHLAEYDNVTLLRRGWGDEKED